METVNSLLGLIRDLFSGGDVISLIIGMIVTAILIPLLLKYLPSTKFDKWGESHGKYITKKGNNNKFIAGVYEDIERTAIGSLFAYVTGLIRGLRSDNPDKKK